MKILSRKDSHPEDRQQQNQASETRNRLAETAPNVFQPQMQNSWNMDQIGQGSHDKKKQPAHSSFSKNAPKAAASTPFYPNRPAGIAADPSTRNAVDPSSLSQHENSQNIIQYNAQNVNFIQLSGQAEPSATLLQHLLHAQRPQQHGQHQN